MVTDDIRIPQCDMNTRISLNKMVFLADFHSYRIVKRDGEKCYLLLLTSLLNQFLFHRFAKIEIERLNYIRQKQKKLRCKEYANLKPMTKTDTKLPDPGKIIVMPSISSVEPCYMRKQTQDAMIYVDHVGRPDFFIPFTYNPEWTEILVHCLKQD